MNFPEKEWTTEAGYPATARFIADSHYCGYVAIDPSHPLFGVRYNRELHHFKIDPDMTIGDRGPMTLFKAAYGSTDEHGNPIATPELLVDVHGSLTYSEPDSEDPDLWWYGFDCAHLGDATLMMSGMPLYDASATFKDLTFVVNECERLASQLKNLKESQHE